ncbi:hypothetical protein [Flexivirga sp. B27]
MKRTKLNTLVVVAIAGSATLLAGCQANGDSTAGPSTGDGSTSSNHAAPTSGAGETPDGGAAGVGAADDSNGEKDGKDAKPGEPGASKSTRPAQYSQTAREADLERATGDTSRSAMVQVSSGVWEAASWDGKGNIWFWRTSGHGWHKIGSSRYPTLPGQHDAQVKVASTILPGMQHAAYLADGPFTGDSSGNDIAFTATADGNWGTVAPKDGGLAPTGKPATDNTTPGIWRDARFTGGKLRTTIGNPFTANAGASAYPLINDWQWKSGKFVNAKDNAFKSWTVQPPKQATKSVTTCPDKLSKGSYKARIKASLPEEDAPYSTVALSVWSPKGGSPLCTVQLDATTIVQAPATIDTGKSWVALPAWMLQTTFQPGGGVTKVYPDQVRAGESPLIAPRLRSLQPDLGGSSASSIPAQLEVDGGKITVVDLAERG